MLSVNMAYAQQKRLSTATSRALNNYIVYANEVVYGINLMYTDFVVLNSQFDDYIDKKADSIFCNKHNILTNYEYFTVFPKELFNRIYDDNIYIPYDKRGLPLRLVGKIAGVLKEIEKNRSAIGDYITSEAYRDDKNLAQGFEMLKRVEVLYYDMFTLQEKLHWSLQAIMGQYSHAEIDNDLLIVIKELQPLLSQMKVVIKSIRAKDTSSSLLQNKQQLELLISQLSHHKNILFASISTDDHSLQSPQKRFEEILGRAKSILQVANEYLSNPQYQKKEHHPEHYYYNIDLLSQYNRYGDGAVTLFNKIINNSGVYWLLEHEMPFLFEVIYPDIPAYAKYQTDTLPDAEEFLKKLLQKRREDSLAIVYKDSLETDSIAMANPVVGQPSLNGFATNNLIFLLDISSSMDEEDKLPLLKEAMKYLLELMREEDNITLITYSTKVEIVLTPTAATHKDTILKSIESLLTEGTSNANKGIAIAYEIAKNNYIDGGNNRIILATDGGFKVENDTKRKIKHYANKKHQKTFLSVFYFSPKEYKHNKSLLQQIANWGAGKYSYIQRDNAEETLLIEAQSVRKK